MARIDRSGTDTSSPSAAAGRGPRRPGSLRALSPRLLGLPAPADDDLRALATAPLRRARLPEGEGLRGHECVSHRTLPAQRHPRQRHRLTLFSMRLAHPPQRGQSARGRGNSASDIIAAQPIGWALTPLGRASNDPRAKREALREGQGAKRGGRREGKGRRSQGKGSPFALRAPRPALRPSSEHVHGDGKSEAPRGSQPHTRRL